MRPSLLITANQPIGERGKVFANPAMTVAVVDRLAHHHRIFVGKRVLGAGRCPAKRWCRSRKALYSALNC
jgi:hypothetical protein